MVKSISVTGTNLNRSLRVLSSALFSQNNGLKVATNDNALVINSGSTAESGGRAVEENPLKLNSLVLVELVVEARRKSFTTQTTAITVHIIGFNDRTSTSTGGGRSNGSLIGSSSGSSSGVNGSSARKGGRLGNRRGACNGTNDTSNLVDAGDSGGRIRRWPE